MPFMTLYALTCTDCGEMAQAVASTRRQARLLAQSDHQWETTQRNDRLVDLCPHCVTTAAAPGGKS